MLAKNCLKVLVLAHNKFTSTGIEDISHGLSTNTSLVELDLTFVNIGDDGCEFLAESIAHHPALTFLKLYVVKYFRILPVSRSLVTRACFMCIVRIMPVSKLS